MQSTSNCSQPIAAPPQAIPLKARHEGDRTVGSPCCYSRGRKTDILSSKVHTRSGAATTCAVCCDVRSARHRMGSRTKKSSLAQLLAPDRIATCIADHHSWTVEGLIKNE